MRGLNGYWYWELIRLCAMWSMLVRDTLYHCWNNTRYHHNYSVQSYPFYRCFALRLHNNVVCMYGLYLYNPVSVYNLSLSLYRIVYICVCVWTINCWLNLSASFFFSLYFLSSAYCVFICMLFFHSFIMCCSSKCASSLLFRLLCAST